MSDTFHSRLRHARDHAQLTQPEAASRCRISRAMWTKFEGGRAVPDEKSVRLMAGALSVSPDWLIEVVPAKTRLWWIVGTADKRPNLVALILACTGFSEEECHAIKEAL